MFTRGFKAWCENTAVQLRTGLRLKPIDSLRPQVLADHLGIRLLTPDQIPSLPVSAREILLAESSSWSAVMVSTPWGEAIVYNPMHSAGRQTSDIMHELSHIVRGHRPSTVVLSHDGSFALRSYDRVQEDEAAWLSGCLLLPRPTLVWIKRTRMSLSGACKRYGVSGDLLRYRMDVTGVSKQFR